MPKEGAAQCPVCGVRMEHSEAVGRHIYAKGRIEESRSGATERPHHDWVRARFGKNTRELKAKDLYDNVARLLRQP